MSKSSKAEALIEAVLSNDETSVSTICSLGDDVDGIALGVTPLIAAAESGFVSILRLLLGLHASPNLAPSSGNYPLRAAINGGDGECIMALIEGGADVNMETARGTPLTTAACLGDVSTMRLLVGAEPGRGSTQGLKCRFALLPSLPSCTHGQYIALILT